jgi:ArsR family transcriptional regulator
MMADLASTTALLSLLADATRVRLMALLSEQELTVSELTGVTSLAQSRVSTHLGRLREAGLLHDRRVGVSTYYRVNAQGMPESARRLWSLVSEQTDDALLASDRQRCEAVVRARTDATAWPDLVAGQMEHHYSPGRTWEALARGFLGLIELGDVLDVGSGDGVVARLIAARASSVTCLDCSPKVIDAARERLQPLSNVRLVVGDMHAMPLPDAAFDHVLLFNVLTYAEEPEQVLAEAHRVLRPGGTLALVTLDEHGYQDISSAYQHVNSGFSPPRLGALVERAGFELRSCEVSSRERRKPYFQVVTAFGRRPAAEHQAARPRRVKAS